MLSEDETIISYFQRFVAVVMLAQKKDPINEFFDRGCAIRFNKNLRKKSDRDSKVELPEGTFLGGGTASDNKTNIAWIVDDDNEVFDLPLWAIFSLERGKTLHKKTKDYLAPFISLVENKTYANNVHDSKDGVDSLDNQRIIELKKEVEDLEIEVDEFGNELDDRLKNIEKTHSKYETRINQLEEKLAVLFPKNKKKKSPIDELLVEIGSLKEQNRADRKRFEKYELESSNNKRKIEELEDYIERKRFNNFQSSYMNNNSTPNQSTPRRVATKCSYNHDTNFVCSPQCEYLPY